MSELLLKICIIDVIMNADRLKSSCVIMGLPLASH